MDKVKDVRMDAAAGVATIIGQSGAEIVVPIEAFSHLAVTARKAMSLPGNKFTHYSIPATWNVGLVLAKDGEKVLVTIDQDTKDHQSFALDPEHAQELAEELKQKAELAAGGAPRRN